MLHILENMRHRPAGQTPCRLKEEGSGPGREAASPHMQTQQRMRRAGSSGCGNVCTSVKGHCGMRRGGALRTVVQRAGAKTCMTADASRIAVSAPQGNLITQAHAERVACHSSGHGRICQQDSTEMSQPTPTTRPEMHALDGTHARRCTHEIIMAGHPHQTCRAGRDAPTIKSAHTM